MMLSILIPAYNEVRTIACVLERVDAVDWQDGVEVEIVVVDDGSTDGTIAEVEQYFRESGKKERSFRVIRHDGNRGKGAAVRSAMQAAGGDILIVQDADLEYEPEDMRAVIQPLLDGVADIVYGSRILREKALGRSGVLGMFTGKHPESYVLAYVGGVMISKWTNLVMGAALTDAPTCYKCFRVRVLDGITIDADDFSWEPEITTKLLAAGHRILEVPIEYHPRKVEDGKKIHWSDGVKALWTVWRYRRGGQR